MAMMTPEAQQLPPRQLFVGGAWGEGNAGMRREVVDPATGGILTTVVEADATDVDVAVRNAREAFDDGPWPRMPARDRARILNKAAQLMRERADELVSLESHDV